MSTARNHCPVCLWYMRVSAMAFRITRKQLYLNSAVDYRRTCRNGQMHFNRFFPEPVTYAETGQLIRCAHGALKP